MNDVTRAPAPPSRLWNRSFTLLWASRSVNMLGVMGYEMALMLWMTEATQSGTLVGFVTMASALPGVLLAPIAGTLADRHSRRRIIITCDVIQAFALLSLAALMFSRPGDTWTIVGALFAVAVVLGVGSAFSSPAIYAAVPDVVPPERLPAANSFSQSSSQLANLLGVALGASLFRLLGAPFLFLFNGFTYAGAAVATVFVRIPQPKVVHRTSWRATLASFTGDLREGFRYVWGHGGLRALVLAMTALAFFQAPVMTLMGFFVEHTLRARADWVGFIMASYGLGSLLGFLAAAALRLSGKGQARLVMGCLVLESAGYALLGLAPTAPIAAAMAMIGGVLSGLAMVCIQTVMQATTPPELRGRVFGVLQSLAGGLAPVGMGLSGIVADLVDKDIRLVYVACGACMGVIAVVLTLAPSFRAFLSTAAPAAGAVEPGGELPLTHKG